MPSIAAIPAEAQNPWKTYSSRNTIHGFLPAIRRFLPSGEGTLSCRYGLSIGDDASPARLPRMSAPCGNCCAHRDTVDLLESVRLFFAMQITHRQFHAASVLPFVR